jgi:hypothetical protein
MAHAQSFFAVGGDGVMHMRDNPLDKLLERAAIGKAQYDALVKYRHHWYHAGLAGHLGSVALDRVSVGDTGAHSGMARTENEVFHRQRYREAAQALGLKGSYVVEWLVCREEPLEKVGTGLGWNNAPQARAAATEVLKSCGDVLCGLWGIGR